MGIWNLYMLKPRLLFAAQRSLSSLSPPASPQRLSAGTEPAVYLTLIEWQNKKDQKKADEVILSTGKLPPDGSSKKPGGSAEDSPSEEEEGNRYNRRMAKKARKKNK